MTSAQMPDDGSGAIRWGSRVSDHLHAVAFERVNLVGHCSSVGRRKIAFNENRDMDHRSAGYDGVSPALSQSAGSAESARKKQRPPGDQAAIP